MKGSHEEAEMKETPEELEPIELGETAPSAESFVDKTPKEPLREWARFVNEDSQSEPRDYLDESCAPHSGE
jgi:hypothetical protein